MPQYTELHPQEAIEEKISLSDRFGLWLSFYPMDQNLYLEIVEHYLDKANMPFNDEVRAESLRWCQMRVSARVELLISFLSIGLV